MTEPTCQRSTRANALLRAFTLIELLVVISIIALLVSILLPALGSARGVAQSAQCKSNEKIFGTAYYMYAADFKDYYPGGWMANTSNNGVGWEALFGKQGYLGAKRSDIPMKTTWGGPDIVGYTMTWDVLECPSETGSPTIDNTLFKFVGMGRSYHANWYITAYGYAVPRPGWSRGPTAAAVAGRMSEADIILDARDSGMYWDLGNYEWGIDTESTATQYAFRHVGNTGNQLFWDGHVETRSPYWISGVSCYTALRDASDFY